LLALDRPWVLLALALPLVLIAVRRFRLGRLRDAGAAGLGRGAIAFPLAGGARPRVPVGAALARGLRAASLWLGFAAAVVAAAGPATVTRRVVYLERGAEAMLVLDVSPSMAASDFKPTRLDAAKAIIDGFLAARRNETVGLVAFGAEAALVCPPTADYVQVASRIASLRPGAYGEGTAIGAGLATAVAHVARSSAPLKRLILLTDGESNAGAMDPAAAAAAAPRFGAELSVVGVGSPGDVPVEYLDPATGEKRSGTYRSGFDALSMEALARTGGGEYFAAENREALAAAFASLSERSASPARSRSESSESSLVGPFMAAALALVAIARLASLAGGGGRP
jgi:Ca-activated chloride channel family protein